MDETRKASLRLFLRLTLVATLCFIWGNSLLPGEESAELSGGLASWLNSLGLPIEDDGLLRKLAHFAEFGLLGTELTLLLRLRGIKGMQNICLSALTAFFIAAADETIQIFSGRGAQISDVLLDFAGGVTGILLCNLLLQRFLKGYRSRL